MNTENLSTLKIHKLTQAQYDRELAAGRIDANALYLTPDEANDSIDYATQQELDDLETLVGTLPEGTSATSVVDYINIKTAGVSTDAALEELQNQLDGKAELSHNHDSAYDAIGSAEMALATAKEYTNTKTSGLASTTTVETLISTHNTSTSAHNDIRALINDLSNKLTKFLDVDDTTTDQLSEVLTLIENNKGTLESLTSSKVNVSDIVDNLTTNSTSKVLSAAQGVIIKGLIDALDAELDSHTHAIADVSGLQSALDGKAASSHGTHVSYSSTAPVMDGTASVGSASTVARSDHRHPTDTSRAAQTDLDALTETVAGKANASHTHTIANITNLQTTLDGKAASGHTHNYAGSSSVGGAATSADKLNTDAGSATQPVYFANGVPKATTYTLGKSVPSDAVFTDTTYSVVSTTADGLVPQLDGNSTHFLRGDGEWSGIPTTIYPTATTSSSGLMSSSDKRKLNSIAYGANNYTHPETHDVSMITGLDNVELITTNDIDTICDGSIVAASEVTY